MPTADNPYRETAKSILTNRDNLESTIQFTSELLRLSDELSQLESDISRHSFGWKGLRESNLGELENRYADLTDDVSDAFSVISNPNKEIREFEKVGSDSIDTSSGENLRMHIYDYEDLLPLVERISEVHDRVGRQLSGKRQQRNATLSLAVSLVAVLLSLISVGYSILG